jgi:hypothetical protein
MTDDVHRVGDLELDQDLQYQQRAWIFQRIGWGAIALTTIAALLGFTGSGWVSQGTVGQPGDAFWVEYERFGRFQSPQKLRIHINQAMDNQQIQVVMSREYLQGVQIQQVTPEPEQIQLSPQSLTYSFKGTTPTAITFYVEPEQIGFLPGFIGLEEGSSLQFQQFIYP